MIPLPMDANSPMVSVVIPVRNEEATIERCLRSVLDQTYPADRLEVLVVDGRSTDRTREVVQRLAQEDGRVRLIDNPDRITPVARNLGVAQARGEIIAIIDGHCWLAEDFLERGVDCLKKTAADCVGGLLTNVARTDTGRAIALVMNSPLGVGNSASRASQRAGFVDHVSFPLYRREVFDRIGHFDPAMVKNQDDEFNYRLRARGGKIYFSPQIRAYYWVRESLHALWRQYFLYGQFKVEVLRRHPRQMQLRQFLPPAFVAGVIAGVVLSPMWAPARWITGLALTCYAGYVFLGTVSLAKRAPLRVLQRVPLVFATLHFAYGLGFLAGIAKFLVGTRVALSHK
ncbi:MAG: glycosyltransferase family 2 protein [candidate division KSB1 bacterium]|nr:glycosyltransferase family 2 protein [candidate division KSB1 bacterium]